jgi:hypothetical protein
LFPKVSVLAGTFSSVCEILTAARCRMLDSSALANPSLTGEGEVSYLGGEFRKPAGPCGFWMGFVTVVSIKPSQMVMLSSGTSTQ